MATNDAHLHVLLPAELLEQMKMLAKEEERSLGAEVRRALAAHLREATPA